MFQRGMLILDLCLVLSIFSTLVQPLLVSELSLSVNSYISASGSLQGGTLVYVKGSGFSTTISENKVQIGPYPCIIEPNGVQLTLVTCRTTKPTNVSSLLNLPTMVAVGSASVTCQISNCLFSYLPIKTPFISQIYPKSVLKNEYLYFFGDPKIVSGTEIQNIKIGGLQCSSNSLYIQNRWDLRSFFSTKVSSIKEAGEYDTSIYLSPGSPKMSLRTVQTSYFTQRNYTHRVVPQINSFSLRKSGVFGQRINITGVGFSTNVSNFTCTVAGENCKVVIASENQLTIEIPPLSSNNTSFGKMTKSLNDSSSQQSAYLGSNGYHYRRYTRNNMEMPLQNWLTYMRSGNVTNTLLEQKISRQFISPQIYGQNYVEYFKGYFFAPIDGSYQFMSIFDDFFIFAMSNVTNNANPANLQTLLKGTQFSLNTFISYFKNGNPQSNATINLTKGYYYFQSINVDGILRGFFKVIVDIPSVNQFTANPAWQICKIFVRPSSSTIYGTFRLLINNTALLLNSNPNLPYNIQDTVLSDLFNNFYNLTQINVLRTAYNNPAYALQLVIEYVGLYSSALPITIDTSLIVKADSNAIIINEVQVLRQYPNRERYSPYPFDFLYMASNTPTLRLTVNSIPAICANCSFQYDLSVVLPVVTFLSRSGPLYQISVSDPGSLGLQFSSLDVSVQAVSCVNLTGTISNFTCSLPVNADGSLQLPAGTALPKIVISQIGYANTSAFSPETFPLTIDSLDPAQSGTLGGIETTIFGSGFPIDSASAESLSIFICGNYVPRTNLTLISNQKVKLIVPAESVRCNSTNNIIRFNGQQSSFVFSYNPCLTPKDAARCFDVLGFDLSDNNRENFVRLWSNVTQWPDQVLPATGSVVEVPYEWNLLLDMDTPVLNYLEVNGNLIFDNTQTLTLEAKYVWIKKGVLRIGSQTVPYSQLAKIILHGQMDDFQMVINQGASGNKILAVTGGLELFGSSPTAAWAKLTKTAHVGDTQIFVSSRGGWKVGDCLVIAPSYSNSNESEEVVITSLNGNLVTFTPPLFYEHYGADIETVSNSFGTIDTRSAVGLLTRNIRVSSAASVGDWGGRILIYAYNQQFADNLPSIRRDGYAEIRGVEIHGFGQLNTTGAALRIENVNIDTTNNRITTVRNSVIHSCAGICLFLDQSSNILILNNVFLHSKGNMVQLDNDVSSFVFSRNLLVAASKATSGNESENVFAFMQIPPIDVTTLDSITVSDNLVQGSQGTGFMFPATECSRISSYYYSNNTAASCEVAFLYDSQTSSVASCLTARGAIAYASKVGLMANLASSNTKRVEYSQMMFADNLRALTLRFSHESDDNTLVFKDSFVIGVSRPSCASCYGSSKISYCNGAEAVRMLAVTETRGFGILQLPVFEYDRVNTDHSFDSKAFLSNVRFQNFFHSHSSSPISFCSNMSVFRRHHAADSTASHYLTNTTCVNCERNAWAYFQPPSSNDLQQCGGIDCTGPNNYFIDDQDGKFTGVVSQILANNSVIGENEPSCQGVTAINGHWCNDSSFAILSYESPFRGESDTEQTIWPVELTYDGGAWSSFTNAWKQTTSGNRVNRFQSVVKLNRTYTLSYSVHPPLESRYQIQKRQLPFGNQNDWIVVKIKYPSLVWAEVIVTNDSMAESSVSPIPLVNNILEDIGASQKQNCGANAYDSVSNEVAFVLNGKSNCKVRIRFRDAVRLLLTFNTTFVSFITENKSQNVIENLADYLQTPGDQLRVTNINDKATSVEIEVLIRSELDEGSEDKGASQKKQQETQYLNRLKWLVDETLENKSIDFMNFSIADQQNLRSNDIGQVPPVKQQKQQAFIGYLAIVNISVYGLFVLTILIREIAAIQCPNSLKCLSNHVAEQAVDSEVKKKQIGMPLKSLKHYNALRKQIRVEIM